MVFERMTVSVSFFMHLRSHIQKHGDSSTICFRWQLGGLEDNWVYLIVDSQMYHSSRARRQLHLVDSNGQMLKKKSCSASVTFGRQ